MEGGAAPSVSPLASDVTTRMDAKGVEDSVSLQVVVLLLSLLSAVTSLIVAATYIHFMREGSSSLSSSQQQQHKRRDNEEQKRNTRSRLLNLCFVMATFFVSVFVCLEPLTGSHFAREHDVLCAVQGGGILFFMSCMVWLWLSIMVRLFLVLVCNIRVEKWDLLFFTCSIVFAGCGTLPPLMANAIEFGYIWCFIDSSHPGWLYGSFYGILGAVCIIGFFLWSCLVIKLSLVLRELFKQRKFFNVFESMKQEEDEGEDEDDYYEDEPDNNLPEAPNSRTLKMEWEVIHLIIRQIVFVFVFEVMFIVTLANRIYITVHGEDTFEGWMLHAIVICGFGFSTFLVFGLTSQNMLLWGRVCRRVVQRLGCGGARCATWCPLPRNAEVEPLRRSDEVSYS